MRILLLAQMDQLLGIHYAVALQRRGHEVTAIHTGEPNDEAERIEALRDVELLAPYRGGRKHIDRLYALWALADKARGPLEPLAMIASGLYGRQDAGARRTVVQAILEREPDAVLAHWGLNAYPEVWDLLALRHRRFPIAYAWNSYPLGDETVTARGSNRIDRILARGVEVRMHASRRAEAIMRGRMEFARGVDLVFPDGFSELSRPKSWPERYSERDGEPHLLTHGTWHVRPHGRDDFMGPLHRIADDGIHVHYPESTHEPLRHPRLHGYPPFGTQDTLCARAFEAAARCDAALVYYAPRRPFLRFQGLLPTRFLSAIAAGLPVALPRALLPACEDFVATHGNGFLFDGVRDLRETLIDVQRLAAMRRCARELSERFTLEARLPALEAALRSAPS